MRSKRFMFVVARSRGGRVAAGMVAAADAPVGPPTSVGTGGAAATVERLATQAAIDTLRRGGNAVDAAVTAAAVLGVTEPFSCGIGGGGFMLIQERGEKKPITIDHREKAPAAMKPDSFWENGAPLAFNAARYSGLSVGVPGTVAGWERALKKHGTISLAEALAPAIAIARNGFVVDQTFADQIQGNLDFFNDIPATAALYLDADGTPRDVGSVLQEPRPRAHVRAARGEGPEGLLPQRARAGDRRHRHAPAGRRRREPRLAAGRDDARRPARATPRPQRARDARQLPRARRLRDGPALERRLDRRRGAEHPRGLPALGPDARGGAPSLPRGVALLVRRPRRLPRRPGLLRRARCAGSSRRSFAATRRALITETAATSPVAPGDPYPFNDKPGKGEAAVTSTIAGSTTHLTVSDRQGNVVSYTFTIESTGGAGLVVPGYGFLLNNELTDFDFDSLTHPNRVEGGKRPRSSMAPTIVLKDGSRSSRSARRAAR